MEGTKAGVCGQSLIRRLSICTGKHATVFQAEVYATLACIYEIQVNARPEKYVSICSDSQVALKTLQAAKTTSSLVHQCHKALNVISTRHTVGLYFVPGHTGVQGNKIVSKRARDSSVRKFVRPELFLGGLYAEHEKKDKTLGG